MPCPHCTQPTIGDVLAAAHLALASTTRLETVMATATEQLTALSTKVDDLVSDVRAALDILRADRENLTTEAQTALDGLVAKVDAFDAEVGDADGSDTPPLEPPVGGEPGDPNA